MTATFARDEPGDPDAHAQARDARPGRGPRRALARDRPQRRSQHLRGSRLRALGRAPRGRLRPGDGVREPDPYHRAGHRLVGAPGAGGALLEPAPGLRADDGTTRSALTRARRTPW